MADPVNRRSPTPPHNTREFQTWVDFASEARKAFADYPPSVETEDVCRELERLEGTFSTWVRDTAARPKPSDRLPERSAFLTARGRALDLLVRLARDNPEAPAASAKRHREAAERNRNR